MLDYIYPPVHAHENAFGRNKANARSNRHGAFGTLSVSDPIQTAAFKVSPWTFISSLEADTQTWSHSPLFPSAPPSRFSSDTSASTFPSRAEDSTQHQFALV